MYKSDILRTILVGLLPKTCTSLPWTPSDYAGVHLEVFGAAALLYKGNIRADNEWHPLDIKESVTRVYHSWDNPLDEFSCVYSPAAALEGVDRQDTGVWYNLAPPKPVSEVFCWLSNTTQNS